MGINGKKFAHAFRGLSRGVRGQSSFRVHFAMAGAVVVAGILLGVSRIEWCILLLCIAGVLAAELFNSALECIARAITAEHDTRVGDALDIASGTVLIASIGAAVSGTLILGYRLGLLTGWW